MSSTIPHAIAVSKEYFIIRHTIFRWVSMNILSTMLSEILIRIG